MTRLPYQNLVYLYRRPAPTTTEYMLLQRTAAHGGFWQGVTGAVEVGESLEQAARREVSEETGYKQFIRFQPLDYRYTYPLDRPTWGHLYAPEVEMIEEECFAAEVALDQGEPVLDVIEHDQYRWLDMQQALSLLVWPESQVAFRRCANLL